jgi:hypothetical protein
MSRPRFLADHDLNEHIRPSFDLPVWISGLALRVLVVFLTIRPSCR